MYNCTQSILPIELLFDLMTICSMYLSSQFLVLMRRRMAIEGRPARQRSPLLAEGSRNLFLHVTLGKFPGRKGRECHPVFISPVSGAVIYAAPNWRRRPVDLVVVDLVTRWNGTSRA